MWGRILSALKPRGAVWAGKVILSALTVGLLAVPAYLLYSNIVDASGAKGLPSPSSPLAAPVDEYYGAPTQVSPVNKKDPDICVTVTLLGVNPASSFANLGILVGVTGHGQANLPASLKNYKNITVWVTSYSGLSSLHLTVPVATLRHAQTSSCGSGQTRQQCPGPAAGGPIICPAELDQHAAFGETDTVYILGQARAFPQDWYQLNDLVTVRSGTAIDGKPLRSALLLMTRDENLTSTVHVDSRQFTDWPYQHQLMFTLNRPFWTIFYTYWISALPFLLLLAILARQWISKRDTPKPYEVAFGIAATLLAILSLRMVLVPATLPALTRLDIIFGIGVTALVAGSIIWMGIWDPGGRTAGGAASEAGGAPAATGGEHPHGPA
jgi:hypothetical protein